MHLYVFLGHVSELVFGTFVSKTSGKTVTLERSARVAREHLCQRVNVLFPELHSRVAQPNKNVNIMETKQRQHFVESRQETEVNVRMD